MRPKETLTISAARMLADMAVIHRGIFECGPTEFQGGGFDLTMVGGEGVWERCR